MPWPGYKGCGTPNCTLEKDHLGPHSSEVVEGRRRPRAATSREAPVRPPRKAIRKSGEGSLGPSAAGPSPNAILDADCISAMPAHGALEDAAHSGDAARVGELLAAGADVDETDEYGRTALMLASRKVHAPVTRQLIEVAADLEKTGGDGWTALMWPRYREHAPVVRLLIEAGADLDKADKWGATALIVASENCHEACARLLIEAGAGLDKAANDGGTALMLSWP